MGDRTDAGKLASRLTPERSNMKPLTFGRWRPTTASWRNQSNRRWLAPSPAVHGETRDYFPSRHAVGQRVGLPSDDTQMAFCACSPKAVNRAHDVEYGCEEGGRVGGQ